MPVSYTHLDVYKRQELLMGGGAIIRLLNTNALEITELVVNNDIGEELLIETFSPALPVNWNVLPPTLW